jgi:hypothetical protein
MRYDSMFVFIKIFINPNNKIKLSNFDSLNALSLIIKYINNNVVANYHRFSDGKSQQSKLMVTINIFFGDTLRGRRKRAKSFSVQLWRFYNHYVNHVYRWKILSLKEFILGTNFGKSITQIIGCYTIYYSMLKILLKTWLINIFEFKVFIFWIKTLLKFNLNVSFLT